MSRKRKNREGSTAVNIMVFLIIISYLGVFAYRVNSEMEEKFTVSDEDSKKCLVDFQERKCNALKLDAECSRLYSCVQKEKDEGIVIKSWSLISVSANEVKESALFPVVTILMLLVYQISKMLKSKEDHYAKEED